MEIMGHCFRRLIKKDVLLINITSGGYKRYYVPFDTGLGRCITFTSFFIDTSPPKQILKDVTRNLLEVLYLFSILALSSICVINRSGLK